MSTTPNSKYFEIGQILERAWRIFAKHAVAYVVAMILFLVIMAVLGSIGSRMYPVLFSLLTSVVTGPLLYGVYRMALDGVQGRSVQVGTLFDGFGHFVQAALASLVVSFFITLGVMACVLPGLVVFGLYLNTYIFLIRDGGDFWSAMEKSRRFAMDNFLPWMVMALLVFFFNCAGAAVCGVGWILSAPITAIMVVIAHDQQRGGLLSVPIETEADV